MSVLKVSDILIRNVCTVSKGICLSEAAQKMSERNISCLLVTECGQAVGILTEADLVHAESLQLNAENTLVDDFLSQPVVTTDTQQSIYDAFEFLREHHVRHLVVVNQDGALEGLLSFTDLLKATDMDDFLMSKKISQQMNGHVVSVAPDEPVLQGLNRMVSLHISCVVVVENHHAIGIFTERDAAHLMANHRDIDGLMMRDVMSSPLLSMQPDERLLDAAKLMQSKKIRRLAIVDNAQHLVGILTQFDVIRGLEGRQIQHYRDLYIQTD